MGSNGDNNSARDVLGEPPKRCSTTPMTGFFRDGCCNVGPQDIGRHVLCADRWQESLEQCTAPRVVLQSTHEQCLEHVALDDLKRLALDLS